MSGNRHRFLDIVVEEMIHGEKTAKTSMDDHTDFFPFFLACLFVRIAR